QAYEDFCASGSRVQPFSPELLADGDVVVDALLGTGFRGAVRDDLAQVIHAINACGRPVFAIDVPSGLDADTGVAPAIAVRADCTVTFGGLNTGLFIGDAPEYAGTVYFDDLEVSVPSGEAFTPRLERMLDTEIAQALPRRRRGAHKGDFGRVLIVGSGVG